MKRYFYPLIVILALAACKKNPSDTVTPDKSKTGAVASGTDNGSAAVKYTSIDFITPQQKLSMTLDGSNLIVVYNEDVILLAQTESLKKAYAVHLKEDFSASDMSSFDYHSLTREGVNAFNWVDDNLNNINKTMKDTVIDKVAITKIEVNRTFTFNHVYANANAALAEYNKLAASKTQSVIFSAYYAPATTNVVTSLTSAKLIYVGATTLP